MEPYIYHAPDEDGGEGGFLSGAEITEKAAQFQEAMNAAFEENAELNTITYVPRDYEIDLDEITSPEDLLNWVIHLSGKCWVDKKILREFIFRVNRMKGWKLKTPPYIDWTRMVQGQRGGDGG